MDVWVVPQASCSGLDKGFLMDVGPERAGNFGLPAHVDHTEARKETIPELVSGALCRGYEGGLHAVADHLVEVLVDLLLVVLDHG